MIVATNGNDILARFLDRRRLTTRGTVVATIEPVDGHPGVVATSSACSSSSTGDDADRTRARMHGFAPGPAARPRAAPGCRRCSPAAAPIRPTSLATIAATLRATGELVDPHTAVGLAVAARHRPPAGTPLVTLATAHPAKFPDAVGGRRRRHAALPARYADLMTLPERCTASTTISAAVEAAVRDTFGAA